MQAKLITLIIFNSEISKNVADRYQRGKLYLSSVLNSLKIIMNDDFLLLISDYRNEKYFVSLNECKVNFASINFIKSNTILKCYK